MNNYNKYTANQDIRDYLADHGVSQKDVAMAMGVSEWRINTMLKDELPQKEKDVILNHIDAIAADKKQALSCEAAEEIGCTNEAAHEDASSDPKFQIGDRVKIPSRQNVVGIVRDIWHSLAQKNCMYAVENEQGGHNGLYAEDQLELAPLPTTYTFEAHIDGNVAVSTMVAHQGDRTWIYARGHAHIIHDGEVGLAQAVSLSARRMFESLDVKSENRIYHKNTGGNSNG